MKSSEMALIINEIYEGVNRSSVGPIYQNKLDDNGVPIMNNLAFHTYLKVIDSIFPKSIDFKMKEDYK